jgi:hypothetical protein
MHTDFIFPRRLMLALSTLCLLGVAAAQPLLSDKVDVPKYPINVGWYPKTVNFAPDERDFIVTACPDPRTATPPVRCTIMRYQIDSNQWQSLTDLNPQASYDDVAYTWDGDTIFAQEYAPCEAPPANAPQRTQCNHLVLLDRNGKKLRNLSSDPFNTYAFPSLTRDGTRILYWGVSNELQAGMGGGAWDVKELDIATQRTVQKTDYQAAFPKTTPRYMPDGKRLMLVAEEYPKRPNGQDFLKPDPTTSKLREVYYMSKFGRNMTVVVDGPRAPVLPYFPTLKKVERDGAEVWEPVAEHMWLMVRDISRDGKLAVYDDRGVGMCFRFTEEPLRKEECFTYKVAYAPSASIAPSKKTVLVVNGDGKPDINWHIRFIEVETGKAWIIGLPNKCTIEPH